MSPTIVTGLVGVPPCALVETTYRYAHQGDVAVRQVPGFMGVELNDRRIAFGGQLLVQYLKVGLHDQIPREIVLLRDIGAGIE